MIVCYLNLMNSLQAIQRGPLLEGVAIKPEKTDHHLLQFKTEFQKEGISVDSFFTLKASFTKIYTFCAK